MPINTLTIVKFNSSLSLVLHEREVLKIQKQNPHSKQHICLTK